MDGTPRLKWDPNRDQVQCGYQGPMVALGDARVGACIGIVPENFSTFSIFSSRFRKPGFVSRDTAQRCIVTLDHPRSHAFIAYKMVSHRRLELVLGLCGGR